MMGVLNMLAKALRTFRRDESGNGTIEFLLVLPGFMLLFTSAYEAGMLSTRQVMLERGLDVTVREVRIGVMKTPTHEKISKRICEVAAIIPQCLQNLRVEMIVRNPRAWVDPPAKADCVDRAQTGTVNYNVTGGQNNELMVLRVCSLFDPMIPTTGLGKQIPKESGGAYALVATSAYVMEPYQ